MKLIGIGGGHIDRRGQVTGDYFPGASNPGTMGEDIGGGALNALRNAVQRDVRCTLISVRGGDAAGEQVARATAEANIIDLSSVFLDRITPSYTALLDRHGDLIAGFADMGLYDLAFPKQMRRSAVREAIAQNDAVLCDANVPQAGLEKLSAMVGSKPFFAIAVSPVKVLRTKPILPALSCLFMNGKEAEALTEIRGEKTQTIEALRKLGLRSGVITSGSDRLTFFDQSDAFSIEPPSPTHVTDVTGAGDALAGVTIAALLRGLKIEEAVREGVAASLLAIESARAVPHLDSGAFATKLAPVPDAIAI